MARNATRDSTDFVQQDGYSGPDVIDMMFTGPADVQSIDDIQICGMKQFKDQAVYTKFMSEPVVITIHANTDVNAAPVVAVGCNGVQRWLPRDKPVRIPRFLVESLAVSHEVRYETVTNPDPSADVGMITKPKRGQCYGFAVVHDPSPHGQEWLRRMVSSSR